MTVKIISRTVTATSRSKYASGDAASSNSGGGSSSIIVENGGGSSVDILKTTSSLKATDDNVFSALYVQKNFLPKDADGSTTGVIDFTKGLKIGGQLIEYDSATNSIKVNCNFYATGGVNALGSGSGGSGGTGSGVSALSELVDVTLGTLAQGDILTFDKTSNHWVNSVANIANWNTAYDQSHTHANKSLLDGIGTTDVSNWNTAYGWGNHALAGYALSSAIPTKLSQLTNDSGYLTSYKETDPIFVASAAHGIATSDITNWNAVFSNFNKIFTCTGSGTDADPYILKINGNAYTTGGFAALGQGSSGTGGSGVSALKDLLDVNLGTLAQGDLLYYDLATSHWKNIAANISGWNTAVANSHTHTNKSTLDGITDALIGQWNTAYGWGNHALAGYLKSFTETDPIFVASVAHGIAATDITNWNTAYNNNHTHNNKSVLDGLTSDLVSQWNTAYLWGNHALAGYLKSYTETDPIFTKSAAFNIATADITNWNNTYSTFNKIFTITGSGIDSDPYILKINGNAYATGGLTSLGSESVSGSGGGLIQTVYGSGSLGKTFDNTVLTDTFNAYTINYLYNRLVTLENKALTSVAWSIITGAPTTLAGYGITDAASSNHTHSFSAITDKPTTLAGYGITDFITYAQNGISADTICYNSIRYTNDTNPFGTSTDGAIYSQAWSDIWVAQIFQDYRTGQIAIRGKNSGTWQAWRKVWDNNNLTKLSQLSNDAGFITSSANVASATLLNPINVTQTYKSSWNPQSYNYEAWGQAFGNSNISSDTGDLTLWLRAGQYGGGTEVCICIDGDYYAGVGQYKVLHANNYTSYSPTLLGGGASGTWNINITGNASTATNATQLSGYNYNNFVTDLCNTLHTPNDIAQYTGGYLGMINNTSSTGFPITSPNNWYHIINIPYNNTSNGGSNNGNFWCTQLINAAGSNDMYIRSRSGGDDITSGWTSWAKLALVTDNVASATKLQTARSIWGQTFDGSGNVDGDFITKIQNITGVDYAITLRNTTCDDSGNNYGVGIKFGLSDGDDGAGKYMGIQVVNASTWGNQQRLDFMSNYSGIIASINGGCANVGIGTTSPAYKLDVAGDIRSTGTIYGTATNAYCGLQFNDFTTIIEDASNSNWNVIGTNYPTSGSSFWLKSIRTQANAPLWILGNYSAGIAFGGEDTKGVLSVAYSSPAIRVAGGNGTAPIWSVDLLHSENYSQYVRASKRYVVNGVC
jgi:hypothetical protein